MTGRPPRRRRQWGIVGTLAAAGIGAMVFGMLGGWHSGTSTGARDLTGVEVAFEPGVTPPPLAESEAVDDEGTRLRVPSRGLDVALGSLDSVDGDITPPGFTSAYVVRDRSVALEHAETGTAILAMHALARGTAPGNALSDPTTHAPTLRAGDIVEVASVTYAVDEVRRIPKPDLAHDEDLWTPGPGRLIMITCLPREAGASLDNLVVVAHAVSQG